MEKLAPLWNQIVQTGEYSIFQQYSWNRRVADLFRDRLEPFVVAVESDSGAAILPAACNRAAGHLELLGETLFDYRDVLHVGEPETLRIAWQQTAQVGRPLSVTAIDFTAAREHWPGFPLIPFANAPEVRRDMIDEEQFRSHHRRLVRHLRRIQRQGAVLRVHTGESSELVRYLYNCKAEQFPADENNVFRDAKRRQVMVDLAALQAGDCEVFTLQSEDEILIAGLVTFRDGGWRRFYTIYFDPAWSAFSPGILLVYEATARSLAEGLNCDYMTGEYAYKLRFANSSRPLYRVDVTAEQLAEIVKKMFMPSAA
jgi:CelD/BcsL family acetyltransferase involved in cellulose biosynthesis